MREVAWRTVASKPDRLVLISPHSPRRPREWGAWSGEIVGDLERFGHPELAVRLPPAPEVAETLGLPPIEGEPLDHGAMVPLHFLADAGWRGPTTVLALPWRDPDSEAMGEALARLPGRTAVIASGDMSHRLIPGAPAGYDPRAKDFDAAFVEGLQRGRWNAIADTPQRECAAEDVVDSTRVALASATALNDQVLSYEGPWGVGYTQAVFHDPDPPLWAIARSAITRKVRGESYEAPPGPPSLGVFCTLRMGGSLRGCIGHINPTTSDLHQELVQVAVASATRDPRFSPVKKAELFDLEIEVTLLEEAQPGRPRDPKVDGCIVSAGSRRGLLLPDIPGIDTVEQQIAICRRKGGIGPDEPVSIETFGSTKVAPP